MCFLRLCRYVPKFSFPPISHNTVLISSWTSRSNQIFNQLSFYGSAHMFPEVVKLSLSWWSLPFASSHIDLIVFLMKWSFFFLLEKVFQAFPNIFLTIFSISALEFIWPTSHIKFVMTVSPLWLHISKGVLYYRHNKLPLILWIDDNGCIILLSWWI